MTSRVQESVSHCTVYSYVMVREGSLNMRIFPFDYFLQLQVQCISCTPDFSVRNSIKTSHTVYFQVPGLGSHLNALCSASAPPSFDLYAIATR